MSGPLLSALLRTNHSYTNIAKSLYGNKTFCDISVNK